MRLHKPLFPAGTFAAYSSELPLFVQSAKDAMGTSPLTLGTSLVRYESAPGIRASEPSHEALRSQQEAAGGLPALSPAPAPQHD